MDKVITDQSSEPLFEWLTGQFEGHDFAPPGKAQHELAYLAAWYVRVYFAKPRPLRRAFIANKLGILSRNLHRAARAASELGEDGIAQVLLASGSDGAPEQADPLEVIVNLQDWARWSTRAAETARLMSWSADDHKGGRTPDARLRSFVTILMDQFEFLLGVKASHTVNPDTGLGHSIFDLLVNKALHLYAPEGTRFTPRQIDDAISWAIKGRKGC